MVKTLRNCWACWALGKTADIGNKKEKYKMENVINRE